MSWTHLRSLIYIDDPLKREFYLEMCRGEGWSTRTLQGRLDSMLFERTTLSRKPDELLTNWLATLREQGVLGQNLALKDPNVLDFLGLRDRYLEKDLEDAILRELENFLLELGADFSFVARQKRLQIDNNDFYIDLLFYNRRLRRLVAIELKLGECGRIFEEKASAGRWDRPELSRLLDQLRTDDVLVVWRLDRLSRSLKDVLTLMETVEKAGAGFLSLTEAVDTTSPAGPMMMQIVGSFAEFECTMLRERTRSGLVSARGEGRIRGRRPKLTQRQQKEIVHLVDSGQKTAADSARLFNVHPSTVARLLARNKLTK